MVLPASTIASTDLSRLSLVKASKLSAIFLCIPKNTLSNFSGFRSLPTPDGVPSRPKQRINHMRVILMLNLENGLIYNVLQV